MKTHADDMAPAKPLSRRRIVGSNLGLSVFCACALIGVFVFSWGFLASPPDDAGDLLNVLPVMCFLATVMCLVGTCRLVLDPDGYLDVINLLVLRRVPVSELVQVEHEDGLRLRLASGRRIRSSAYQSSLLGAFLHYPRSLREARRIEAAIDGLRKNGELRTGQQDTVRSKLRVGACLGTLAVNAALVLGTVVLNAVETTAQH